METKVKKVGGRWRHLLAMATLPLLLIFAQPLQAGTFELDGNALDSSAGDSTDDWSTPPDAGSAEVFTGIMRDAINPANKTAFSGGPGDKDTSDVSTWTWSDSGVPDKDDLSHAYAAAYDENGHRILYFGADRISNAGDAFMGFWFFKRNVALVRPGSTFSEVHEAGDTLVLINFPQGANDAPNMHVVKWDTGCSKNDVKGNKDPEKNVCAAKNLRTVFFKKGADGGTSVCVLGEACALTNAETIDVPTIADMDPDNQSYSGQWSSYLSKNLSQSGKFPFESFFEGRIDLTALGLSTCFSSFMAETRSSSSFTATLKDFVVGAFSLCGFEVTKVCENGRVDSDQRFAYDVKFMVHNKGIVPLSNLSFEDTPDTGESSTTFDAAAGVTVAGGATVTIPASGAFTLYSTSDDFLNNATATANAGSVEISASTTVGVNCETPNPSAIVVTKTCYSAWEETADNQLVLRVNISGSVCNKSPVSVSNITLTDDPLSVKGAGFYLDAGQNKVLAPFDDNSNNPTDNDCAAYSDVYYPSEIPTGTSFSDTITAQGTAVLFGTAVSDSKTITCPVCPSGSYQCPSN